MAYILHHFVPLLHIIPLSLHIIAYILIAVGIILGFLSTSLFLRLKTDIHPKGKLKILITTGVFQLSRNPIYLGMLFILIGVVWYFGSVSGVVTPIIFVILINKFIIPFEETMLLKKFGKDYETYKNRVRRWI